MSARQILVAGTSVVKSSLALPATATGNLFTVTGGGVMVTGLLGRVTTATGATVTTLSLGTTGSTTTSLATATAITSAAAGTFLIPSVASSAGGALTVTKGPAFLNSAWPATNDFNIPTLFGAFFLANDVITWTTSATDTGAVTWYLWYLPIDTSASVS
jgi:hypothetical protein